MAAVLACGPGAVLSHRSAAALHGLRATSRTKIEVTVARTIADLADVLPDRAVERALEQAEITEVLVGRALDDQLTRHPRAGRLRRLLARGAIAPPTESELEERFLVLCRAAGLPEPERQVHIDPGDGGAMVRVDFLWREQRLVVETDGAAPHGTRRAFERDRRRDQRLIGAGWQVIRVTWRQIVHSPQEVIDLLATLLPR
jgi:hypothetical protein